MDYEPDEQEQQVLEVMRSHGRANPMLIREETDLRKEYVSRALDGLQKAGVVRRVTRGLYEHVPENDDQYDAADQGLDVDSLRDAVADARSAIGNDGAVEHALDRIDHLLEES